MYLPDDIKLLLGRCFDRGEMLYMANIKMMQVSMEILKVMMNTFPREHLEFTFGGILEPGDIVEMAMLELILVFLLLLLQVNLM